MGNNTNTQSDYNNLITTGFGFLNDFRFISGNNGEFAVVTCALLVGRKDEQKKTYINCIVTDAVADLLDEVWDENVPTTAAVKISDIYADPYLHQGKPGANLKGKLIKLEYLKVGDDIIELDEAEEEPPQQPRRSQSKSQPRQTQQRKSQGYQGQGKQRSQRSTTTRNGSGRTRSRRAA